MQEPKCYFPCVWAKKMGSQWIATVGMKLEALLLADLLKKGFFESTAQTDEQPSQSLMEAFKRLAQNLIAWGPSTYAEIHWTSWPKLDSPPQGRLDITFTLHCRADSEVKAKEEVLTHFLPFQGLLLSHLPWALFMPIQEMSILQERLSPFVARHSMAIIRRNQPLCLSLPLQISAPAIGFLYSGESKPMAPVQGSWVDHIYPWVASGDPLHRLVDFLLWYQEPAKLDVRLQAYSRPEYEKEALLKGIQRCHEILEGPVKTRETILANQAVLFRDFLLERMAELSRGMVSLSAYLSTRGPMDEALIQNVALSFLGTPAEMEPRSLFKGGASFMAVSPEKGGDPDFSPEDRAFSFAEAACFFRIPSSPREEIPGIPIKRWRSGFADLRSMNPVDKPSVLLGHNIHHGVIQPVCMGLEERLRHLYIVGQTGTGKSTILENLLHQDLHAGRGLCLIDPHGDLIENILSQFPMERKEDLILIDLTDNAYPFALNLLSWGSPEERERIIDDLYVCIDRMYDMKQAGGPIFEKHFRGMLRLLMGEGKHGLTATLLEFPLLYTNPKFRKFCLKHVQEDEIWQFIKEAEDAGGEAAIANLSPYITSKFSRFIQDSRLRRIFGQEGLSIDFARAMEERKVVLINLARGVFGEKVGMLVASQMIARFKAAAMARRKIPPDKRQEFFLYVDEFQSVADENIAQLLSEARKYRMGLILANQYTEQLQQEWVGRRDRMLSSILGNVGMIIAFRLGLEDARRLEEVFRPTFSAHDLMELPNHEAYMKVHTSLRNIPAFNLKTIKPPGERNVEKIENLKEFSRTRYCQPAAKVDEEINKRRSWINKICSGDGSSKDGE